MANNLRQGGGDAGTSQDSADQQKLRNTVLEEIEAVLHKHEVGGAVFIASRDSSAWRFVIPKWSGITLEGPGYVRVRISSRTPALKEIADSTMHYVAMMRDMCIDGATLFARLFQQVEDQVGGPGSIEHRRRQMGTTRGD